MNSHSDNSRCVHFGSCGGCSAQDLGYEAQLAAKARNLEETFRAYWESTIDVAPAPQLWNYRNKVDFSFGPKQYDEPPPKGFVRDTVLGFNKPGKWYWPFDVEECHIGPAGNAALLNAVREWYPREGLRAYDSRADDGFLRILLVRDGKRTGERMVAIVTSPGDFPTDSFVEAVQTSYPCHSIYRGTFSRSARVAEAEELFLLDGEERITEELHISEAESGEVPLNLHFSISPFSFFQVNPPATEVLYGKIRRWVANLRPSVLYDLYGGSGGIALSCADLAGVVRSVESVESATQDGLRNASDNGIENVFFETARVKTYLQNLLESGGAEPGSAAIVDPPRSGMVPKALRRLVQAGPEHLLYVSCKPEQTATELGELLTRYRLESIDAVDMFPHTPHVEAILALTRL